MAVVLKKMGKKASVIVQPLAPCDQRIASSQRDAPATVDDEIVLSSERKHEQPELLSQCDPMVPPPADLVLWDAARLVGGEVL